MFFYYSGQEPLQVLVPGEQYAILIEPSARSQHTTNQKLYDYIFSSDFEQKSLFVKTEDWEPPVVAPKASVAKKPVEAAPKPAEGGTE